MEITTSEKEYLKEQDFLSKNVEEIIIKVKKADIFRKANGFSLTMSKLMAKWNCSTPEDYRRVRAKHKKENYVGPRKPKKIVAPVVEEPRKEKKQWQRK